MDKEHISYRDQIGKSWQLNTIAYLLSEIESSEINKKI